MIKRRIAMLSLVLIAGSAHAKFQSALPAGPCAFRVEDLAASGAPLNYQQARRLRGEVKIASNGTVELSGVKLPTGREATIAIDPTGCARLISVDGTR